MATGDGQPRGPRGEGRGGGPRNFRRQRPKACMFCVDKLHVLDYKDLGHLRPMVTDRGKIKSRGQTGTCAFHQRMVAAAIKRARHMALLPFVAK